jgi:hypothetical protein
MPLAAPQPSVRARAPPYGTLPCLPGPGAARRPSPARLTHSTSLCVTMALCPTARF